MSQNLIKKPELSKTFLISIIIFIVEPISLLKIFKDIVFYKDQSLETGIFRYELAESLVVFILIFYFFSKQNRKYHFLIFTFFTTYIPPSFL
jgi:hypothetical protein